MWFSQVPDVHYGSGHCGGVELRHRVEPSLQDSQHTRHDGVDQRGK